MYSSFTFSTFFAAILVLFIACAVAPSNAGEEPSRRAQAAQKMKDGNFKDAYDLYGALALDPQGDARLSGEDLKNAVQCLLRLNRENEVDDFREQAIAAHAKNWRFLAHAADTFSEGNHFGFIVAGKFSRGQHRGGGKYAATLERDRVRALQLLKQAIDISADDPDRAALSKLYSQAANTLMRGGFAEAWRLQDATDLDKLPDYEEGVYYGYRGRGNYGGVSAHGAPVNADGTPVYYKVGKSFADAASDGERWRYALAKAEEFDPSRAAELRYSYAQFLQSQFDVRTMAGFTGFGSSDDKDESGPFAVKTLGEDETIARLATGIKRFKLPDEFNFIKIYQSVADKYKNVSAMHALISLADSFEDRQQYVRAAEYWKRVLAEYHPGQEYEKRLAQVIGNWGQFEGSTLQAAGEAAKLGYRFRNGNKASFEATEINVAKLLEDVKAYIRTKPGQLNWEQFDIGNIGYRLVEKNQNQYLGAKAAAWDLPLQPRDGHFDRLITVQTPLKKPGAYFVTAKMADGNTSRIVLWVADTALVKKQLDNQTYLYVADAVSGNPVPNAKLDLFGYSQQWENNKFKIDTTENSVAADGEGQVFLGNDKMPANMQWLLTATTPDGRFAHLGFTGAWYGANYDQEYNQIKTFGITDRPVYRPEQSVKFKFWTGFAKYDYKGAAPLAGQAMHVEIHNPLGEKIYEKDIKADEYGGIDGEFPLVKDATLGNYQISVPAQNGYLSFRIEEYKKPEFQVTVDAPGEPVMLGEKIKASIKAKYYFGAPVAQGKVKYKVLRYNHSSNWYPAARWDWFYEPGYWWFASDYSWYPGWKDWGMRRPIAWWYGHAEAPPEVVLENEAPLKADGTFEVEIDTAIAKAVHGNIDHRYEFSAEVTDASRRTITGTGSVIVARKPFSVYAWVDRGHYSSGDVIQADFSAQTLDHKPVQATGTIKLLQISYDKDGVPAEKSVQEWPAEINAQGLAHVQLKAAAPGQYRLSCTLTDAKKHTVEGGYLFVVTRAGFTGAEYRFNDIELVPEKREYAPGEKLRLLINVDREKTTVLLFPRATNGVCLKPILLHLDGKSTVQELGVTQKDMPNFFIEALTVGGGKLFSETKEIVVPPESRVTNVEVLPSAVEFKPGQKAHVKIKLTDQSGEPITGTTTVSVYDKAVEYISGGSNVAEIRAFFWKWRRSNYPRHESSLDRHEANLVHSGETLMNYLGAFGAISSLDDNAAKPGAMRGRAESRRGGFGGGGVEKSAAAANMAMDGVPVAAAPPGAPSLRRALATDSFAGSDKAGSEQERARDPGSPPPPNVEPTVRKNFADTAFWAATLNPNAKGLAEFDLTMPESLTTWKMKVWSMSTGTRVGQGEVEVLTKKNIIIRLQSPRFFTQKDEVVLSANVHNFLAEKKKVEVSLEFDGSWLEALDDLKRSIEVEANGEQRVDWRVKVSNPGQAAIRAKALTDEESDAMELKFPAYIHGMSKMDSFAGNIRLDKTEASLAFTVPAERRAADSRIEVRYSPTLAGAMVDALPYLVEYPYGCTEQTLNRFLPAAITQKVLLRMNINLKDVQSKITNLNAQEIGDDTARAKQWKHGAHNPVFDEAEVRTIVKSGVDHLAAMQCADGGWGWFSGTGEYSYAHTTAYVVHGLQIAKNNGVEIPPNMLERGVAWLKNFQSTELTHIRNAPQKTQPYKESADNLDAFAYMVLTDAGSANVEMRDFLYRDRNNLAVYAKAMFGLALNKFKQADMLKMILENIGQYLVEDNENQTAYLKLPENNYWWYWYGSEYEAQAYYLKLLAAADPKSEKASRLVKYLLNNRRHATYWNSTRDTAICVEAMAEYLTASGEDAPDMSLDVVLDGKVAKTVAINASNLFTFDNKLVLTGDQVTSGAHKLEFRKKGTGPVYFNAYVTNFTLEDPIAKAGLEIKVNRAYYKLKAVDKKIKVEGGHGQSVAQKVEKFDREALPNLSQLKSGDLIEIELEIDSKNDYEYILFEDMKAAGFEPVEVRSGYNGNDMGAYMELRDERVCFFVRTLARGKHSVSYRLRAEIPGIFSALPTRASAMYAPELKANSDEIKMKISD